MPRFIQCIPGKCTCLFHKWMCSSITPGTPVFPPPSQTPSATGRHMAKDIRWRRGQEALTQTLIRMSRNVREEGEDDDGRHGKENADTVALFPERSRLSWPKQSQSPQPRKTNGGKSQPGGFDPLKGLWDLINMQLFFFVTCSEMCVACAWMYTQGQKTFGALSGKIKYQTALWVQSRKAQRYVCIRCRRTRTMNPLQRK